MRTGKGNSGGINQDFFSPLLFDLSRISDCESVIINISGRDGCKMRPDPGHVVPICALTEHLALTQFPHYREAKQEEMTDIISR